MLKEFKAFALRGNVVDLAAGVVIGVAFNAIVKSLVDDIFMQVIAAIFGEPDFTALTFNLDGTEVRYGAFLTTVLSFIIIAFVLFFVVRAINRLNKPKDAPAEPPSKRLCPECATEIPVQARRCPACTSEIEPFEAA